MPITKPIFLWSKSQLCSKQGQISLIADLAHHRSLQNYGKGICHQYIWYMRWLNFTRNHAISLAHHIFKVFHTTNSPLVKATYLWVSWYAKCQTNPYLSWVRTKPTANETNQFMYVERKVMMVVVAGYVVTVIFADIWNLEFETQKCWQQIKDKVFGCSEEAHVPEEWCWARSRVRFDSGSESEFLFFRIFHAIFESESGILWFETPASSICKSLTHNSESDSTPGFKSWLNLGIQVQIRYPVFLNSSIPNMNLEFYLDSTPTSFIRVLCTNPSSIRHRISNLDSESEIDTLFLRIHPSLPRIWILHFRIQLLHQIRTHVEH